MLHTLQLNFISYALCPLRFGFTSFPLLYYHTVIYFSFHTSNLGCLEFLHSVKDQYSDHMAAKVTRLLFLGRHAQCAHPTDMATCVFWPPLSGHYMEIVCVRGQLVSVHISIIALRYNCLSKSACPQATLASSDWLVGVKSSSLSESVWTWWSHFWLECRTFDHKPEDMHPAPAVYLPVSGSDAILMAGKVSLNWH